MMERPYIREAQLYGAPEDTTEYIGVCRYCGKPLIKNPEWECDEWIETKEKGYICRACFGSSYFDELLEWK